MRLEADRYVTLVEVLELTVPYQEFSEAVGLTMDAKKYGMGLRSQRYSMLVEDGVVKALNVEAPGAFEVSSAEHMLKHLGAARAA